MDPVRKRILAGDFAGAVSQLEKMAAQPSGDQLVYVLDYATVLSAAGDWKASNRAFLAAEQLADLQDYHSVSRITGSMLWNEEAKQYKGDTFEKVFISAYLAMNHIAEGDFESAQVAARRINEKYQKYRLDDSKDYELNPFAKYLAGLIWEAVGNMDFAFLSYQDAWKLDSEMGGLSEALVRTAKLAKREREFKYYSDKFSIPFKDEWRNKNYGEIVLIHQQGWGPRKQPNPLDYRFPVLVPVKSFTQSSELIIDGVGAIPSVKVYDVSLAAIKTLEADMAALVARRVGAEVVKYKVAEELDKRGNGLGSLYYIAAMAADRADVRHWSTLPETIQVARTYLKAGTYLVRVVGKTESGDETGEDLPWRNVVVHPGKKTFLIWRSFK
ncbi:MAG: hypothetical protein N2578_03955 [Bdellovibrionaceae bacterium]|nr:hypothetical protein [Pseudobdellovibrionaceae bacterium]